MTSSYSLDIVQMEFTQLPLMIYVKKSYVGWTMSLFKKNLCI